MEKITHIATFLSLIYGLGVANVLVHLARLFKQGQAADWFWVHVLWTLLVLLMLAGYWWELQNWGAVPSIGFFNYLSLLLAPALLFLACELLFPDTDRQGHSNLRAHYFAVRRPFFVLLWALSIADDADTLQKGWHYLLSLGPGYLAAQLYWWVAMPIAIRSRSERTHGIIAITTLLVFLWTTWHALARI